MLRFAIATLAPVGLLVLSAVLGGYWTVAALLYLTVFTFLLDHIQALAAPQAPEGAEFPAAPGLSFILALAHFVLLGLGIAALSGMGDLPLWARLCHFAALGLFLGQISNSNAHELIHHPTRWMSHLGTLVYVSVLFGHHTSANKRVHHVFVGSPKDPNTARPGEGFYIFALRAWREGFVAGWRAENMLRARSSAARSRLDHPYVGYVLGAALTMGLALALAGPGGLLALLALAAFAQIQLLMSDYVQHYGLKRHRDGDGKLAPVGPEHSWNAPHWFSSATMLNAPRHSDHHLNPSRPFTELRLDKEQMPYLPFSLPVMALIALYPSAWRDLMDPILRSWRQKSANLG